MSSPEARKTSMQLLPVLQDCATSGKTITYAEAAAAVGKHQRGLTHPLAYIRELCVRHNLPRLDVLVVHAGDSLPGDAFFEGGRGNMPEETYRDETTHLRAEVHAYPDWNVVIPNLIRHYSPPA